MKKICAVFALFFTLIFSVMSLYSAPAQTPKAAGKQPAQAQQAAQTQPAAQQQLQAAKPKTVIAKSYSFAEELIELPIKPFVANKLTDAELLNTSQQLLKIYEAAVNAEKQENVFKNPAPAIKAWREVVKITDKNPFLQIAKNRLTEWKTCIELFNRHQDSLDKIKTFLPSTLLTDGQKTNMVIQHLDEFGLSFGTQEIIDLIGKTNIPNDAVFQAKVKETKEKRCEKNSGKDCFECAKATTAEPEQLALFEKSCGLRFQPGCDEANKIKAAKEAEKAKLAAEEKLKTEEFAKRSFALQDEALNLITPFVLGLINEQDIFSADRKVLKMFEDTVNREKQPDIIKTPCAMIVAWEEITKITEKNPFMQVATQRLAEWKTALEKLEKYEAKAAEMKKVEADNALPVNYRTAFAVNYLNEFGVTFGTTEVIRATVYSSEISGDEAVKTKIREIRKQRCDLNSAIDCQTYAMQHSANEDEKAAYLKKACDLGRKTACSGNPQDEVVENAQPKTAEQPKKELTEEEKFKEELNQAGRKKRLTIATSTLVAGAVVTVLGGISFYGANQAQKDYDKYFDAYNHSTSQADMDTYRKKTQDADSRRKTYKILGGVGIGVGAALIATGITFYCIEFESEKEVKKKYNVSFGASPMDRTIQFALNW